MVSHSSSSRARCSSLPSPLVMSVRMSSMCLVPSRQGVHLPQDSSCRKVMKYLATSTMQVCSSMTIMPPEPMMEPTDCRLS